MSALLPPEVRRPFRAPEKSAALLALQGQGLELPSLRKDSISPQSNPAYERKLRLSPLSIISTPSIVGGPLDVFGDNHERNASAMSFETEVSHILNLYMNSSRGSLKSEYEEEAVTVESGDEEDMEEERISIPSFHQPKAYRDTIAPLLEHQFSSLTVPSVPSPISVASMPMLIHPNAAQSVPSLYLSPGPHTVYQSKAAVSGTSIQMTPEMSPKMLTHLLNNHGHMSDIEIALEVPDVREADGWYDQPLSPVSPEAMTMTLRDSQMSAVSPNGNEGFHRQLTFEALAPPAPQRSPNARPVDYYEDISPAASSRAVYSEIIDNHMVPPPLALNRGKSPAFSTKSPPVRQPTMHLTVEDGTAPKSRHASLIASDPIEGPMRTYLTPPPPDRLGSTSPSSKLTQPSDVEEMYRSGSAFSDSTVDSPVATAKFGKQLKKALRLGKKKKNKNVKKEHNRAEAVPDLSTAPDNFTDDVESYKYGYWKSHALAPMKANNALPPPHRLQSPEMEIAQKMNVQDYQGEGIQRHSAGNESNTRVSLRPTSKPEDWPMARPTEQSWYEANKPKNTHDSYTSHTSAASTGCPPHKKHSGPQYEYASGTANIEVPEPDRFSYHNRPASRVGHVHTTSGSTTASQQSAEARSISRPESAGFSSARRSAGTPMSYNNDLFEASGGKKRSGFGSRLFMSAEEKRKMKVKESIVVVGGGKMGGGNGRDSGKALVNI